MLFFVEIDRIGADEFVEVALFAFSSSFLIDESEVVIVEFFEELFPFNFFEVFFVQTTVSGKFNA